MAQILGGKSQKNDLKTKWVTLITVEDAVLKGLLCWQDVLLRKSANGSAGEPISTEDTFLRRKEAQLKERRAQQQRVSQNVSSPVSPSPTATEKTTKDIKLKASTVPDRARQKDEVHAPPVVRAPPVPQNVHIEPFYFPTGKPPSLSEVDITVQRIKDVFSKLEGGKVDMAHMKDVSKVGV